MDTEKHGRLISVSSPIRAVRAGIYVYLWLHMTACGGNGTLLPTPSLPTILPTETLVSTAPILLTPTPNCIDGLTFIDDVTIPDFSVVAPGISLDKQWLVQNSGSCNWDSHYRLRLIDGDGLGASPEQALYPARAGMQATLRIVFTAPQQAGEYYSEWQAFNAQGIPFGESFFIKIIIQ